MWFDLCVCVCCHIGGSVDVPHMVENTSSTTTQGRHSGRDPRGKGVIVCIHADLFHQCLCLWFRPGYESVQSQHVPSTPLSTPSGVNSIEGPSRTIGEVTSNELSSDQPTITQAQPTSSESTSNSSSLSTTVRVPRNK